MFPLSPLAIVLLVIGAVAGALLLIQLLWGRVRFWVLRFLLGIAGAVIGFLLMMGLVWMGTSFNSWFVTAEAESPAKVETVPTPVPPQIVVQVVMPTQPAPTVTNMPQPTAVPVITDPMPVSNTNIWWSSPDAFDSTAGDYALGDKDLVVYGQTWDGKDVATTKHFVVMPGLILRIKGWVGTRWMLNGRDDARWQEMRIETQKRDNLKSTPDLIVIDSLNMRNLPAGWSIEAFPSPNP